MAELSAALSTLAAHAWRLAAMAGLLCVSAFFSGSETALFSLSRDRLRRFRSGRRTSEHLAARLVAQPRSLLVTILLGNMIVNVTFYAVSSSLVWDLASRNRLAGGVAAALTLLLVVVLGEVAPKTIAATAPAGLARLASVPLYILRTLLRPLGFALDHWVVEPLTRLVTGRRSRSRQLLVTTDELQAIVELASDQGAVGRDESEMINEVLELHEVHVREVMVPRVDMVAFDLGSPTAELLEQFRSTHLKRTVVYRESVDQVVGLVSARRAFLEPERPVAELVEPVHFVPEQATVETLLKVFRENQIQIAVVVDEYGGTAGLVTLEDCLEQIIGDIQDEYDHLEAPPERLSDREFLLAGNMSMRAWSDYLLTELDNEMDVVTLGGLVTALLGRLPRVGDTCTYGNLRFTVREVTHPSAHPSAHPSSHPSPHPSGHPSGPQGRPTKVLVEILEPPADGDAGDTAGPAKGGGR